MTYSEFLLILSRFSVLFLTCFWVSSGDTCIAIELELPEDSYSITHIIKSGGEETATRMHCMRERKNKKLLDK